MLLPDSSYVLLLRSILLSSVFFFQDAFSCEKPAYTNVAFDTTEQETEQPLMRASSNSLYGSASQICHSLFGLDFSKRGQEKLYAIGTELPITVIGLFILCLLLRHIKNIKPSQDMIETVPESTQDNQEMLEQLVKNTHKINKYMKLYVIGRYRKEMKSKLSTRRKYYEMESERFLPVCSCQDSA